MKFNIYITIALLFCCYNSFCQSPRKQFNEAIFNKLCLNSAWMLEDSTKKKKEEEFGLAFAKNKTLTLIYVNWIEGMAGAGCKYTLSFKNDIAEIATQDWANNDGSKMDVKSKPPAFIYCYHKNKKSIFVLLKDNKQQVTEELLKDADWMELKKVKE